MDELARVEAAIAPFKRLAVAVSGGVDSLTLATAASRLIGTVEAIHAVSPAVPEEATARVEQEAFRQGWRLRIVDAGEFGDPDYLRNPVNRCYFCKANLYRRIASVTDATIAAGTNLDDLGEYRPGLEAAEEHRVVHPFVAAGITKAGVRRLAARLGLGDIAELPAQPCLASRIETGIAVDRDALTFVAEVERVVIAITGPGDVRCRITMAGVAVELAPPLLTQHAAVAASVAAACARAGRSFLGCRPYRRGSAFLTDPAA